MREFQGEKAHRPKKDFACRMCAGPPTSEMPKSNFLRAAAFCCSVCRWCFGGIWLCFGGVGGGDVICCDVGPKAPDIELGKPYRLIWQPTALDGSISS